MFDTILEMSRTWGFVYFVILFAIVLVYALAPRNKDKFDRAARLPLEEE